MTARKPGSTTEASRQRKFGGSGMYDLTVTQHDIDHAVRADSGSCMIADALKRQVAGISRVTVDQTTIRFSHAESGKRIVYPTPLKCADALLSFDYGRSPPPFKFRLVQPQITEAVTKRIVRDAEGAAVVNPHTGKAKLKVTQPSGRPKVEVAGGRPTGRLIGGKTTGLHHASLKRTFGARGLTWEPGEDPEVIAARHAEYRKKRAGRERKDDGEAKL